jgi:hypothetical protein
MLTMNFMHNSSLSIKITIPFLRRLACCGLVMAFPTIVTTAFADDNPEYPDFYSGKNSGGDKNIDWVQSIAVSSPAYGANIKGDVTVNFSAPGMTKVKVLCWQQPDFGSSDEWGHDAEVASDLTLDDSGKGSFVFHADQFPNGPITVRIYAKDNGKKQDLCELQLFNQGGVPWKQGIPKNDPPGAEGMKLVYSDDFNGPLSISDNGNGAKYAAHKTGGGDFSGWQFANVDGPLNPFSQVGTYLRIHASKTDKGQSSGILSSSHEDGTGFYAGAPCYFECRFLAQSAPGTWPAFWLLSKNCISKDDAQRKLGADELDIIEAYGGQGPGNPNFPGYAVTSHYWGQKDANGQQLKDDHADIPIMDLGSKSTWSTTFHTYGIKITKDTSTYYFDDMPVFTYPTKGLSKTQPFWFLINYAIGGISGWKIHLDRYGNATDMWVDYVRVYQGDPNDLQPPPQ